MANLDRIDFDLVDLRAEVVPKFTAYDEAVRRRDAASAKKSKLEITRVAIKRLDESLPRGAKGIYLFAGGENSIEQLNYIGIAARGTLLKRMTSRFRDETCLDQAQYGLERDKVWDKAYRRLCVSMASEPSTLIQYAFQHVKTTALFSRADRLIFFVTDADSVRIKAAESLLIYSAVSAGAPLVNIQEREKLATDLTPGIDLAFEVIKSAGIEPKEWGARAESILSKFGGDCC